MEAQATIPDAVRKTCEAYTEGLSAVMKALEHLPRESGEAHRRMVEQWLTLARTSKDSFVAALNQGFELWERECRRAVGAPHAPGIPGAAGNPLAVWAETWKHALETYAGGGAADVYREAIRRQGELVQQTLEEGMRAWQRLWEPAGRK
ncbi:MAG TPA: hypothetical protein VFN71_15050 [Methylomirabilota bacterium]|nr:hypothetical protein [Methylomirabilota bacterium]